MANAAEQKEGRHPLTVMSTGEPKMKVTLLVAMEFEVETESEAIDATNEILRPQLIEHEDNSCLVDYRVLDGDSPTARLWSAAPQMKAALEISLITLGRLNTSDTRALRAADACREALHVAS